MLTAEGGENVARGSGVAEAGAGASGVVVGEGGANVNEESDDDLDGIDLDDLIQSAERVKRDADDSAEIIQRQTSVAMKSQKSLNKRESKRVKAVKSWRAVLLRSCRCRIDILRRML